MPSTPGQRCVAADPALIVVRPWPSLRWRWLQIVVALVAVWPGPRSPAAAETVSITDAGFVFAIEASANRDQVLEVFFEAGTGWSAEAAVRRDLPGDGAWHRIEFLLPARPLRQLRLDPGWGGATVSFRNATLAATNGRQLAAWALPPLKAVQQIAGTATTGGVLTVTHLAEANDPILLLDAPLFPLVQPALATHGWPRWLAPALAMLVAAALLWAFAVLVRLLGAGSRTSLFAAAAVFLVVFGLRLAWIERFGSPVPYNDEWDAEARVSLLSWRSKTFDSATLLAPHNEHRIALSRLSAIGLAAARGHWDPRSGMIVSAALVAALAAVLTLVLAQATALSTVEKLGAAIALTALFALPSDAANLVWGGQTQMYLLLALAVATLAFATHRPLASGADKSPALALAAVAFLSLGSMGSGFVAPLLGAFGWFASERRRLWPAVLLLGLAAVGWFGRASAPHHETLHAQNLGEWWATWLRLLAWPWPSAWLALLVWLPFVALGGCAMVRRKQTGPLTWFAIALGAWLLLQTAALAYSRARANAPEPRHLTLLIFTPVVATISAAALRTFLSSRAPRWASVGLAVFLPLAVVWRTTPAAFQELAATRELRDRQLAMVRQFLATGDRRVLSEDPRTVAPYQNPIALAGLLEDPQLRPLLPAAFTAPTADPPGYGWALGLIGLGALSAVGAGFRAFRRSPED